MSIRYRLQAAGKRQIVYSSKLHQQVCMKTFIQNKPQAIMTMVLISGRYSNNGYIVLWQVILLHSPVNKMAGGFIIYLPAVSFHFRLLTFGWSLN